MAEWERVKPRVDDAVLFVPSLNASRMRVTAWLALLPRANRRWLADSEGRCEEVSLGRLMTDHAPAIARHAAACGVAAAMARWAPRLGAKLAETQSSNGRLPVRKLKRVLYLRSQFWMGLRGGGSVGHTAGVINALREIGIDVRVLTADSLTGVEAPQTVIAPERWADGALGEIEEMAYNVPFLSAALRLARAWRPDAIYQRYDAFNATGAALARLLGVPFVLEFNSSEVWKGEHWGGLYHVGAAQDGERLNLAAADLVVVVSRVLAQTLKEQGVPAEKILVNPNGVDPRRFDASLSGEAVRCRYGLAERVVVGFSGTFGPWHGIPTLAKAIPLVLRQRPDARFLLLGDGGLRKLADDAADEAGVGEKVVRPGLVDHAEMPEHLAACDVLLSPHGTQADGQEFFGSPTKLFEYMAMGRGIVASAVGQIAEVLEDGRTALLIPPDDPERLAASVVRLIDDVDLRRRLGAAARREAEAHHTWRSNAERLAWRLGGTDVPREARVAAHA